MERITSPVGATVSYDKYGSGPPLMLGMEHIILDRISVGGVKDLQEIYQSWTVTYLKPMQYIILYWQLTCNAIV